MRDALVRICRENRDTLILEGRNERYEHPYRESFFLTVADAAKLPNTWRDCIGEPDRGFVEVAWPERYPRGEGSRGEYFRRTVFEPRHITPLEADVRPERRFLIDNPSVQIASDWRLLYLDIETENVADWDRPWESRVLSVSWASARGRGHIRAHARTDAAERALFVELFGVVLDHDIVLAWNGAKFDFPVLQSRATILDVAFDVQRVHWLDHLQIFRRYYQRTEDGAVKQSFKLDDIAASFLGSTRKLPVEQIARSRGFSGNALFVWLWEHAPDLLEEYNDRDVELMQLLEQKTEFVRLHTEICALCRILPDATSMYPSSAIDGRMLMRGRETGYRFPTKRKSSEATTKARGAFVPDAVTGLHESVAVLDFARMYPSIILSWNMSLETIAPKSGELVVPETSPRGVPLGTILTRFRASPEGHLPAALRGILEYRERYKAQMKAAQMGSPEWYDANRLQTACKILANTFYGSILSPYSRYYVRDIGESITSIGRHLLHRVIGHVGTRGKSIVFGDTDSVAFVATDEEAEEICTSYNRDVLAQIYTEFGVSDGKIELEYEKRYARICVTASKRYVGRFAVYGGKPARASMPIDVRGLEIVRSDVCAAARLIQKRVVEQILAGETPEAIWHSLHATRSEFAAGEIEVEDLVLRKGLTKRIEEYVAEPIQARVARQMLSLGLEVQVGQKIQYLVTRSGPIIPETLDDKRNLDLELYWNAHVYAPTQRVLRAAFPSYAWRGLEFVRGIPMSQLSLFGDANAPRKLPSAAPNRAVEQIPADVVLDLGMPSDPAECRKHIARIKSAFAIHPGKHAVRATLRMHNPESEADVEFPARIADPNVKPELAAMFRALGIRWRLEPPRGKKARGESK